MICAIDLCHHHLLKIQNRPDVMTRVYTTYNDPFFRSGYFKHVQAWRPPISIPCESNRARDVGCAIFRYRAACLGSCTPSSFAERTGSGLIRSTSPAANSVHSGVGDRRSTHLRRTKNLSGSTKMMYISRWWNATLLDYITCYA